MTQRSSRAPAKGKIVDATIAIMLETGLRNVTHQSVSKRAGVSLASTTYHYKHKQDFVEDAARSILWRPIDRMKAVLSAISELDEKPSFAVLALEVLGSALGEYWEETLSIREILIALTRDPSTKSLAREWADQQTSVWSQILGLCRDTPAGLSVRSVLDFMLGVETLLQSVGKGEVALRSLANPDLVASDILVPGIESSTEKEPVRASRKSHATRETVLEAAKNILVNGGIGAMTHQAIASEANLTLSVPTYHFSTKSRLLSETFQKLAEDMKSRYRAVMSQVDYKSLDLEDVVALTDIIIRTETSQFQFENLAIDEIKIWAGRDPEIRPILWDLFLDHTQGWDRLFETLGFELGANDSILIGCITTGKITRLIETGNRVSDLIAIRRELQSEISSILNGDHWFQQYPALIAQKT